MDTQTLVIVLFAATAVGAIGFAVWQKVRVKNAKTASDESSSS